ncbi:MAG TPA: Mur ligase domain-containing protein, partial [Rhabdochlamydiaceae bacterium]
MSYSSAPKRYHFIGIGGIGMSALATILLQKGLPVSGSDLSESYTIEALKKLGAVIYLEHREENIQEPAVIVYSSAVKEDNPEMRCAKRCDYPLMHRSELLHFLMKHDAPLLVTGTHGKTTTSALLTHLLIQAELHPSFAIGGILKNTRSNGGHGTGPYFVAEADESDGSFLAYSPFGAIITNIDQEHLDHWKDYDALIEGFRNFALRVKSEQHLFWCGDDEQILRLKLKGLSYG